MRRKPAPATFVDGSLIINAKPSTFRCRKGVSRHRPPGLTAGVIKFPGMQLMNRVALAYWSISLAQPCVSLHLPGQRSLGDPCFAEHGGVAMSGVHPLAVAMEQQLPQFPSAALHTHSSAKLCRFSSATRAPEQNVFVVLARSNIGLKCMYFKFCHRCTKACAAA